MRWRSWNLCGGVSVGKAGRGQPPKGDSCKTIYNGSLLLSHHHRLYYAITALCYVRWRCLPSTTPTTSVSSPSSTPPCYTPALRPIISSPHPVTAQRLAPSPSHPLPGAPRQRLPLEDMHEAFSCRDAKLSRVLKLPRQLSQVTREGNLPGKSTRDPLPSTCHEKLSAA